MKKILATIIATVLLFSLSGCEKFLTELPKSTLVAENSFTTEADWQKALTGAYAMLQKVFMEKYTMATFYNNGKETRIRMTAAGVTSDGRLLHSK